MLTRSLSGGSTVRTCELVWCVPKFLLLYQAACARLAASMLPCTQRGLVGWQLALLHVEAIVEAVNPDGVGGMLVLQALVGDFLAARRWAARSAGPVAYSRARYVLSLGVKKLHEVACML